MTENDNIPSDLCTIQRAAELLGVSQSYLKKLIREGKAAKFKLGAKRTLVSPNQIRMLSTPQSSWWPGTLVNY
ncbi:MAG: helix-turn-helix domain-containing protein [Cyclobacteriaceae bacterium]|nr:helix-turn-helix domain-containing protein [Cyclobacteriaceae bacterium]